MTASEESLISVTQSGTGPEGYISSEFRLSLISLYHNPSYKCESCTRSYSSKCGTRTGISS